MTRFHLFLSTLALFFSASLAAELLKNPNTPDPCLLFLQDLTNPNIPIESRSIEVNNTLAYSGHNLNDLGNYRKCNNKSSQAFSLVSLSVTGMSSMMGFCAPSYCSTGQLQQYSENVIQFLTNVTGKDVSKLVQVGFIDPTQTGINKGFWLYFSIILFSALGALLIIGTISANIKRIPKREKSQLDSHNGEALKEALLVNPFPWQN